MNAELAPAFPASGDAEWVGVEKSEKRRHLVQLVVNSVSRGSQPAYRLGVEQFFDWWGACAAAALLPAESPL